MVVEVGGWGVDVKSGMGAEVSWWMMLCGACASGSGRGKRGEAHAETSQIFVLFGHPTDSSIVVIMSTASALG
jgi:hypothetical protein